MKRSHLLCRAFLLALCVSQAAPSPAYALRAEQSPAVRSGLEESLQTSDGPEEIKRGRAPYWTKERVLEVIRRAASSRRPKLSLAPGAIVSKEQRSSGLGVELYRAYAAVTISKSVPELAGWPSALKAAGLDPGEIYRESWDREKVVEVIQRAASSRRPKLSLAPGAIQSAGQRSSGLGAELYHAYKAVVASKSVPELADWPAALKAAGLDPGGVYTPYESWDREKVVEVIQRAASSRRPKLSLAPGAIQSAGQRSSGLGAELYHAYAAVVTNKSVLELAGWPSALEAAGLDPSEHYRYKTKGSTAGMEEADEELSEETVRKLGSALLAAGSDERFAALMHLEELLEKWEPEGSEAQLQRLEPLRWVLMSNLDHPNDYRVRTAAAEVIHLLIYLGMADALGQSVSALVSKTYKETDGTARAAQRAALYGLAAREVYLDFIEKEVPRWAAALLDRRVQPDNRKDIARLLLQLARLGVGKEQFGGALGDLSRALSDPEINATIARLLGVLAARGMVDQPLGRRGLEGAVPGLLDMLEKSAGSEGQVIAARTLARFARLGIGSAELEKGALQLGATLNMALTWETRCALAEAAGAMAQRGIGVQALEFTAAELAQLRLVGPHRARRAAADALRHFAKRGIGAQDVGPRFPELAPGLSAPDAETRVESAAGIVRLLKGLWGLWDSVGAAPVLTELRKDLDHGDPAVRLEASEILRALKEADFLSAEWDSVKGAATRAVYRSPSPPPEEERALLLLIRSLDPPMEARISKALLTARQATGLEEKENFSALLAAARGFRPESEGKRVYRSTDGLIEARIFAPHGIEGTLLITIPPRFRTARPLRPGHDQLWVQERRKERGFSSPAYRRILSIWTRGSGGRLDVDAEHAEAVNEGLFIRDLSYDPGARVLTVVLDHDLSVVRGTLPPEVALKIRGPGGQPQTVTVRFAQREMTPEEAQGVAEGVAARKLLGELMDAARAGVSAIAEKRMRVAVFVEKGIAPQATAAALDRIAGDLRRLSGYPYLEIKPFPEEPARRENLYQEYAENGFRTVLLRMMPDHPLALRNTVYVEIPSEVSGGVPVEALAPLITDALGRWGKAQAASPTEPPLIVVPAAPYLNAAGLEQSDLFQKILADRFA